MPSWLMVLISNGRWLMVDDTTHRGLFVEGTQREATCTCGATFTQMRVSPRFPKTLAAIADVSPEGYLPVWCPPCEHRSLARGGPSEVQQRQYEVGRRQRELALEAGVSLPDW